MRVLTGGFNSTSPQPEIDFLFFRLTFLFLATVVLFAAVFVGVGVDFQSVSITSISTRILDVGSWSTVHCGTVTGCVWVCGVLVTTWTRPVDVVIGKVWLGLATELIILLQLEVNIEVIQDVGKTTEKGRGVVGRLTPSGGAASLPVARVFSSLSVLGWH